MGRASALAGLKRRIVLLALPALALSAGPSHAQQPPIVVGAHIPLTGGSTELGQGFQSGAEMAFAEINQHGGINGRPLKLVIADDRSAPDVAITAVQRLTTSEKPAVLWNGSSSSPTVAVVPRLRAGPLPYYVGFASDPRVLEPFSWRRGHPALGAAPRLRRSRSAPGAPAHARAECFASVTDAGCDHQAIKTGSGSAAARLPRVQVGQHGAGHHQGGGHRHLPRDQQQARAALLGRVRAPLQSAI